MRISTPLRIRVVWLETRDDEAVHVSQTFDTHSEALYFAARINQPGVMVEEY